MSPHPRNTSTKIPDGTGGHVTTTWSRSSPAQAVATEGRGHTATTEAKSDSGTNAERDLSATTRARAVSMNAMKKRRDVDNGMMNNPSSSSPNLHGGMPDGERPGASGSYELMV